MCAAAGDPLEYTRRAKPLSPEVELAILARSTPGFVGADLENLVNEAAILAARRNKKIIGQSELEEAIDRVIAGPERRGLISVEEKRIVAYRQASHTIVAQALPTQDPSTRSLLSPRAWQVVHAIALPQEDRTLMSKSKFLDDFGFHPGRRCPEEIVFQDITSGASNDAEQVTRMARSMVTRLGMSPELGPMVYGQKEELIFLGREISEQRDYSEAVAEFDRFGSPPFGFRCLHKGEEHPAGIPR